MAADTETERPGERRGAAVAAGLAAVTAVTGRENSQWTVPVNATVSQLLKIGKQPVSFSLGARYYACAPDGGPDWGLRFGVTFLFPK